MSRISEIQRLIIEHNRHLQLLKEKEAKMGVHTSTYILTEIKDRETKIVELEEKLQILSTINTDTNAPLVTIFPEPPYGTMPPESPFYIERDADKQCQFELNRDVATTIYIKAPEKMGKSSLVNRLTHGAKQKNKIVTIDFSESFVEDSLTRIDEVEFLKQLCHQIAFQLGLPDDIASYWQDGYETPNLKFGNYVSSYIIPQLNMPLILVLDETQHMLKCPFRNSFFGMLRAWHNARARDENFAKLSLILVSSTEPRFFIDDTRSPFNVVSPIVLQDFTFAQVSELSQRHPVPLSQDQVNELTVLLGGHPYLTRLALYQLAMSHQGIGQVSFRQLVENPIAPTSPFVEYLKSYWQRILKRPELKQVLWQICYQRRNIEDHFFVQLEGLGLVKPAEHGVEMRNELYKLYFKEQLGRGN